MPESCCITEACICHDACRMVFAITVMAPCLHLQVASGSTACDSTTERGVETKTYALPLGAPSSFPCHDVPLHVSFHSHALHA